MLITSERELIIVDTQDKLINHYQGVLITWIPPTLSLAIRHYHPPLLLSPLDGIQCPPANPRVGVYRRMSPLTLLPQHCQVCLSRLTKFVGEIGGKLPYIYCFVWCYFLDLRGITSLVWQKIFWCLLDGVSKVTEPGIKEKDTKISSSFLL